MRIDGNIKYKSRNLFFQVRNISSRDEFMRINKLLLDWMLVAQAVSESLTLVTHDRKLKAYEVSILWT
jgi:PIN domain nuclease of toxin-antitoxin system